MKKVIVRYDGMMANYKSALERAYSDTRYIAAVMFCLGLVVGIFIARLVQ